VATSGTYTFNPKVREVVDEAFERCGIDPAALVARHITSARRSFNFMFSAWANEDMTFKGDTGQHTVTAGENSFTLDAQATDVGAVTLKRSGAETPMERISQADYRYIYDKTIRGRPSVFYLDRLVTPVMRYWQAAENSTDIIVYEQMYRIEDILTLAETIDVPHRWLEAVTAGLAVRLAVKHAPDRYELLKIEAEQAFSVASSGDDENVDLHILVGRC
jgi:hypothetical protein